MNRPDLLSILITFVVGVLAGGYLYVAIFASIVEKADIPDQADISKLSIIGDVYGGCRERCSSFQVLGDASFKFLYYPTDGGGQKILEGKLPLSLQNRIDKAFKVSELERQSVEVEGTECASYTDGIDVVYEITLDGKKYIIDSCSTASDGESALWKTLSEIWQSFTK